MRLLGSLLLATQVNAFGTLCGSDGAKLAAEFKMPEVLDEPKQTPFRVGYIGDIGESAAAVANLRMIAAERADLLVFEGDFTYVDRPDNFFRDLDATIGTQQRALFVIGNHDVARWTACAACTGTAPGVAANSGFTARINAHMARSGIASSCTGAVAENQVCQVNGGTMTFALSGVGTRGTGHAAYIDTVMSQSRAPWKICNWHKNQRIMQLNTKSDETGWAVYASCLAAGAMVATGHEHSYCRSVTMTNFQQGTLLDPTRANPQAVEFAAGRSIVFVSGLGGQSIRAWDNTLAANRWWTNNRATQNGASNGALFCDYLGTTANCYYKERVGTWTERFSMTTRLAGEQTVPYFSQVNCTGVEPSLVEFAVEGAEDDAHEADGKVPLIFRRCWAVLLQPGFPGGL